uniref:methyl-CpG-binding domain protein 1 isoform X22 n=1 Tax=Jaculus jaculus TaxID=51337 RepID=UPI001E1B500F|nr:methyl-CpG-binding domain protein 1 isoform X22 [Jaculus jaculus]
MAEDWLDCPALGPGWKRREAFRKSGVTCGRSDIYYQSPTGDKIRSKVELTRYLGPACDLTLFNFKQGILCYPTPKTHSLAVPSKKQKKPPKPSKARKHQVGSQKSEVRKETPQQETKAGTNRAPVSFPAPGCCENCGIDISGDGTRRQRLKTLCKDCRAQRIAFNREQRMFKRVGCGECAACLVTEDCGACSTCLLQLPRDVASGLFCKCEQRRCLRIVKKSQGCGVCRGCQTQEDCGRCQVCLRPHRPGLRRRWRCVQRRCLWGKKQNRRKGGSDSKKASRRHSQSQPLPRLPESQPPKPTELKRLLPSTEPEAEERARSPPRHHRRKSLGSAQRSRLKCPTLKKLPLAVRTARPGRTQAPKKQKASGDFVLPPPGTDLVFLREGASSPVQVPAATSTEAPLQEAQCSALSWVVALPQVKQEKADAPEEWTAGTATLRSALQPDCPSKAVDPGLPPVKQEPPDPEEEKEENKDDFVSELAPEEETGGAGTPVITEIFSLGGTRLRDTAVWLPRLCKLLAVNENECFTELQLKEETL